MVQREEIEKIFNGLNKDQLILLHKTLGPSLVNLKEAIQNKINMLA